MKKFLAVIASVTLLAFAVPAMAQEATTEQRLAALEEAFQCSMKFYGSVRMTTFWLKDNSDFGLARATVRNTSVTNLNHTLQGNARIGGRMQVGDLLGHFEYGHDGNGAGNDVRLRVLTGEWNFGAGKLLIGQTETPTSFFTSTQVVNSDANMLGWGSRYIGRQPMVQLTMGDFKFAAVRPFNDGIHLRSLPGAGLPGFAANDTEYKVPQLQASYTFKNGPLTANLAGAYQTYDVVATNVVAGVPGAERTESIDSYMLALGAIYNIGPAALFGDFSFGQNFAAMESRATGNRSWANAVGAGIAPGSVGAAGANFARPVWDGSSIQDADTVQFLLGFRYKINDMVGFEAAYGQSKSSVEYRGLKAENTRKTYYLQLPITLAKGVFIVPEAGVLDYGEDEFTAAVDVPFGKQKYFGAKWQINF